MTRQVIGNTMPCNSFEPLGFTAELIIRLKAAIRLTFTFYSPIL